MYKVSGTLNSAYGSDVTGNEESKAKSGPGMPQVTSKEKRLTNVKLPNGEIVQGIRKNNKDLTNVKGDLEAKAKKLSLEESETPRKPLRYTPGLVCDSHLESLRPPRDSKHQAFEGGEWKKNLIRQPKTYEGSFADADMEKFRPEPNPPPVTADPWYTSRLPDAQPCPVYDRLGGAHYLQGTNPYNQVYPQDELSLIKQRNRRFLNTCGQEMMMGGPQRHPLPHPGTMNPMYGGYGPPPFPQQQFMYQHPMMMMGGGPQMMYPAMGPQMPMGPMMQQQPMPMMNPMQQTNDVLTDLRALDEELNTTRRITRPFVPTNSPDYFSLQKLRDLQEEPTLPGPAIKPKSLKDVIPQSVEDLPPPKKVIPKDRKSESFTTTPKPKPEVRMADQIAIRSLVLGQNLSKAGSEARSTSSGVKSPSGNGVKSPSGSGVRSPTGNGVKSPGGNGIKSPSGNGIRSPKESQNGFKSPNSKKSGYLSD